ncbi:UDP-N-acetylglucosamine 1-carboxyvinyltransferase [Planctomycetota bacterium]
MEAMIIKGGRRLSGTLQTSGAKNATLPIMAAAILADGPSTIENVPSLKDVSTMREILETIGVKTELENGTLKVDPQVDGDATAPYELVKTMRASVCVLGPLLAKTKKAKVSLPGGCVIGPRPIDIHLKGLRALGADIEVSHGYVEAKADRLCGSEIFLGGPAGSSVLATANVMMAAVLAEGETVIENAAMEPEVADLAGFLVAMGAEIHGVGGHRLTIRGVTQLKGTTYRVIGDRIEAGTLMCAAAATGGDVELTGVAWEHLAALVDILRVAGVKVDQTDNGCHVSVSERLTATDAVTLPYPGFPTDMQAQVMALLSTADGTSTITETVFPERFIHAGELNRMGADIGRDGPTAIINGVEKLTGAPVMASDLRASAALIIAGLIAEETTTLGRIYHLDRGYEHIEEKLSSIGADIRRVTL